MRRLFASLVLTLGIAVLAGLAWFVSSDSTTNAAFPGTNGKIAFDSDRYLAGFYAEIETTNPDGTGRQLLVLCSRGCDDAAWTPDGQRLALIAHQPYNLSPPFVDVVNADGTGFAGLLPYGNFGYNPAWSPDNVHIAYEMYDGAAPYHWQIWTANTVSHSLTKITNNAANNHAPVWSPDGSKIAFHSDRDGNDDIYVMNVDGSGPTRLTNNGGRDIEPDWSPDGSKLVFASDRDGNYEVYVMDADGSDQTRITNDAGRDEDPVWSPDGTRFAFTSDRDGNREIYTMNADGSEQNNITNDPYDDYQPDWQPIPLAPMPTSTTAPTATAGSAATSTPQAVGGVAVDPTASNSPDVRVHAAIALGAVLAAGTSIFTLAFRLRVP